MERKNVELNNPERFAGDYKIPEHKIKNAVARALGKLERNMSA